MPTDNSKNEFTSQQPQKLAPHSQESEEATLGAALINPDVLTEPFDDKDTTILDILHGADFYFMHHRFIWDVLITLLERGDQIDALTVTEELRYRKDRDGQSHLDKIGGSAFITYLINNTPTHIHAPTYARIVARLGHRRRILDVASSMAKLALADDLELEQIVDQIEEMVDKLTLRDPKQGGLQPIATLLREYLDNLEERYENRAAPLGIFTGLADLDKLLHGIQKGDVFCVGARPGVGKTALMLNIAFNAAKQVKGKQQFRVAVFSLEMSKQQLLARLYSSQSGVNSSKLRTGDLDESMWDAVIESTTALERVTIDIDDTANITVKQIRRKLRYGNYDLVIIDYLQLLGLPRGFRPDNRTAAINAMTREIKVMAMDLQIPVIFASQVGRAAALNTDKKPELENLKESGGIEENSDIVVLLHVYPDRANTLNVNVAKHRNGATGEIDVYFDRSTVRVKNIEKTSINLNSL